MGTLCFDSLEQMPPGMRHLVEKKLASPAARTAMGSREEVQPAALKGKQRKYHNLPTERRLPNGNVLRFRSKKEAVFFDELMAKQATGTVRDVRMEVQFLLKPAYTDSITGERFRAINYLADFVYEEKDVDGTYKRHIIDTKGGRSKGTRTKDYAIKRKLMADLGYHIEEK